MEEGVLQPQEKEEEPAVTEENICARVAGWSERSLLMNESQGEGWKRGDVFAFPCYTASLGSMDDRQMANAASGLSGYA